MLLIADVWVQGKTMPKKTETSADRKKGVNDLKGKIKDLESEAQRCVPFFHRFLCTEFRLYCRYKKQIQQLEVDREDIGQVITCCCAACLCPYFKSVCSVWTRLETSASKCSRPKRLPR